MQLAPASIMFGGFMYFIMAKLGRKIDYATHVVRLSIIFGGDRKKQRERELIGWEHVIETALNRCHVFLSAVIDHKITKRPKASCSPCPCVIQKLPLVLGGQTIR